MIYIGAMILEKSGLSFFPMQLKSTGAINTANIGISVKTLSSPFYMKIDSSTFTLAMINSKLSQFWSESLTRSTSHEIIWLLFNRAKK